MPRKNNPNWGGDRGPISPEARPTVNRVVLSNTAAQYIRSDMLARDIPYSKTTVSPYVSGLIEATRDYRVITALLADPAVVLPWLEEARRQCSNEEAQRGLDALIAAVMTALARKEER